MRRLLKPAFALFFSLTAALAQAGALDAISSGDASAGVKEALAKGADYAVSSLGKNGGFLGNDKVKIKLPSPLDKAESALRMFGIGVSDEKLILPQSNHPEIPSIASPPLLGLSSKLGFLSLTVSD